MFGMGIEPLQNKYMTLTPEIRPTVFQEKAAHLQVRLDELYTKFQIQDLRAIPDDENFKILSAQRGTRESFALKLKTLQDMISEGATGYERALVMAERMIQDWENFVSREKAA